MIERRELARALAEQLRRYMREKTPQNNIVAVTVLDLFAWASMADGLPKGTSTSSQALEEAAETLREAGICQIVTQQTRSGGVLLQIRTTPECQTITDDQITARLFPERS